MLNIVVYGRSDDLFISSKIQSKMIWLKFKCTQNCCSSALVTTTKNRIKKSKCNVHLSNSIQWFPKREISVNPQDHHRMERPSETNGIAKPSQHEKKQVYFQNPWIDMYIMDTILWIEMIERWQLNRNLRRRRNRIIILHIKHKSTESSRNRSNEKATDLTLKTDSTKNLL